MTTHSMVAHAFRRLALPLGCYYAVTLGLPLANGAAHSGAAFLNHAVFVLVIPPILIVLLCTVQKAALLFADACRSTPRAVFSPFRDYPHVYGPLLQVAERDPLGEAGEPCDASGVARLQRGR